MSQNKILPSLYQLLMLISTFLFSVLRGAE